MSMPPAIFAAASVKRLRCKTVVDVTEWYVHIQEDTKSFTNHRRKLGCDAKGKGVGVSMLTQCMKADKGRRHPTLRGLALIADADGEWAVNLAREPAITITHDDGRNVYRDEYALNGVAHLPTARDWANDQLRYILNPLTGRVDRDRRALTIQNLRAEVQGMLQTLRADVAPPPPLQPRSRRPAPQPTPSDVARMWSSQSGSPPPEDSGEGGDYVPGTEQGEREVWTGKKGRKRARKTSGETAPGTSRSHAAKRSRSESPLPPQFARKSSARRAPSVITISSGSSGSRLRGGSGSRSRSGGSSGSRLGGGSGSRSRSGGSSGSRWSGGSGGSGSSRASKRVTRQTTRAEEERERARRRALQLQKYKEERERRNRS
eukprot:jgi/Mesvir1/1804/Mv21120-RA.1